MGDDKGKGVLAGGGVLAMLASVMAHGADDCVRIGARGATATLAVGQAPRAVGRLGTEVALGARAGTEVALGANASRGLTHGVESVGASALRGSEGVALSGAHGVEASGVRNLEVAGAEIAGGRVGENGARSGGRAFSGSTPPGYASPPGHAAPRPGAATGRLPLTASKTGAIEHRIAEESPGYVLDAIRLADPDDESSPPRPGALYPGKIYLGLASYMPLHEGSPLLPPTRERPLEVRPAPSPGDDARATLARIGFSLAPLIMTGWLDDQDMLQLPGGKLAREALFERCRVQHVGCFLVASRGAPSPAGNERMATVWRAAADESLGPQPGGPEVARALAISLLRSRARLDTGHRIAIAHSGLDGPSDTSFVWSPPGDAARQP